MPTPDWTAFAENMRRAYEARNREERIGALACLAASVLIFSVAAFFALSEAGVL